MTDEEVIASFMEPKPTWSSSDRNGEWWWCWDHRWHSCKLDLDALHEVEARLTNEQWDAYANLMMDPAGIHHTRFLLHASAEQKIEALAAVLRPEVEATPINKVGAAT